MKIFQILKIIIVNVFIFLIIIVLFDYLIYKKYNLAENNNNRLRYIEYYKTDYSCQSLQSILTKKNFLSRPLRDIPNNKKKPIFLFGCSYTYGHLLEDDETFDYILSKYTNRPVYNFGINATGVQHMLCILQQNRFFEETKNIEPEYIIYTFISSHLLERMNRNIFPSITTLSGDYLQYKIKNNKLKLQKFPIDFITKTYIYKFFNLQKDNLKNRNISEKDFILFNAILLESKKIIKEKYPNSKFIILKYDDEIQEIPNWANIKIIFEKEGFIILETEDLVHKRFVQNEYFATDKVHPSKKTWELIVPALSKKLNL